MKDTPQSTEYGSNFSFWGMNDIEDQQGNLAQEILLHGTAITVIIVLQKENHLDYEFVLNTGKGQMQKFYHQKRVRHKYLTFMLAPPQTLK